LRLSGRERFGPSVRGSDSQLLLDRDPIEGRDLASQPTLSRFENRVGVKELYRVGEFLAESVIRRHTKRLRHRAYRVTIDLDPTDDPTARHATVVRGCHAAAFVGMIRHPIPADSCTPGWRVRASGPAPVSGRPAQTRICRRHGQECSVDAGC